MSLKLRPTGLVFPIDKDRKDYTVFSGKWEMGRIYGIRSGPEHMRTMPPRDPNDDDDEDDEEEEEEDEGRDDEPAVVREPDEDE